jgi:hypothetical protein
VYASIEKLKDDKGMPHARALPPPRRGMAWRDCDRTQAHHDMMWCRVHWFCHLGYLMIGVSEVLRVSAFVTTGVAYMWCRARWFCHLGYLMIGVSEVLRVSAFVMTGVTYLMI